MNLIKYRPVTGSLIDWDFDTALEKFFTDTHPLYSNSYPRVDVRENGSTYIVEADLPGLIKKDIDVKIDGDLLTISSVEKKTEEKKNEDYIIRERPDRHFSRSFTLPDDVERADIKAHFSNGVLRLELPKKPEAKPRSIEIKAEK